MLVCSTCMEKEKRWVDSSIKYQWSDDCVPLCCSCEQEYYLMLPYVDKRKKPFPCSQIRNLEGSYIKEKGEINFSLYHNQYVLIQKIYKNGSFVSYPLINKDTKEIDNSNAIYYDKTGFTYDNINLDLLISNYESKEDKFIFLNKFIFNTQEHFIFDLLEKQIDTTKYKKITKEYNDDIGFYFEMYSFDNKTTEELYIQNYIKILLIKYFNVIFQIEEEKFFNLLVEYHKINDLVKCSDVFNCDCGCNSDTLTDLSFEIAGDNIEKRKNLFIKIFKIAYYI